MKQLLARNGTQRLFKWQYFEGILHTSPLLENLTILGKTLPMPLANPYPVY